MIAFGQSHIDDTIQFVILCDRRGKQICALIRSMTRQTPVDNATDRFPHFRRLIRWTQFRLIRRPWFRGRRFVVGTLSGYKPFRR